MPKMTLMPLAALAAAGKACATPWSVTATAGMPQAAARLTASPTSVSASMEDIWVWRCSSTLFSGAVSRRTSGAGAVWMLWGSSSASWLNLLNFITPETVRYMPGAILPRREFSSSLGKNRDTRTLSLPSVISNWSTKAPLLGMSRLPSANTFPDTITLLSSALTFDMGTALPLIARPMSTVTPADGFFPLFGSSRGHSASTAALLRPYSDASFHSRAASSAGAGMAGKSARTVMVIDSRVTTTSCTRVPSRFP